MTGETGDPKALAALRTGRAVPLVEVRCSITDADRVCGKLLSVISDTATGCVARSRSRITARRSDPKAAPNNREAWNVEFFENATALFGLPEEWSVVDGITAWCPHHGHIALHMTGSGETDGRMLIEERVRRARSERRKLTIAPPMSSLKGIM